ncbi:NCS2 family permease [Enterocloster clostridioformis]|uniref:NCS2 family permease n=1 Tax=Enterocloster clostridioformis TaxID=1531 RepID=UPI00080C5BF6|nr:NCS2 family permease [Enterocloster clostridioformis]ANU50049.1 NCS2 family permease [Lachnoclostridium sp. YL32]NDO28460.1 NCS2 family permease [Enterocloster clostridioformis]OXE70886.1 NCS2 family permease [Enterocloster clostridioformis]QQR01050.1 NCS2 family permease [Enterocloster clostridioformis]
MKQETGRIDRFFQVSQNHSSVRTEVLAGITTFITIAYILILNPQILADSYVIMGDAAMAGKIANGVFIGTCIGAFIGTILCALYARVPFAQAPGIGLFITIIGLKNAGIVISNPATLVSLVDFSQWKIEGADLALMSSALVALAGLVIMGTLHARKIKGSILLGIVAATLIGIPLGVTHISNLDMNIGMKFRDFAEVSFVKMDFAGLFSGAHMVETIFTVTMLVISFSLVNMFDSIGTLLGAAKQSGMIDENGEVIRMKQALMSDAISTAAGAMVGTSTVTTVVESSAGIAAGGRTGLTSLVTALMFLGAILFAPIVSIVPAAATAPALIFVGILMLGNIRDVDFSDMSNALPAFCTIVFMPFTYSIANGVAFGLITYCLMKLTTGRRQDVKVLTLAISVVFVVRYAFMTLG